jgi:hypothetical protein
MEVDEDSVFCCDSDFDALFFVFTITLFLLFLSPSVPFNPKIRFHGFNQRKDYITINISDHNLRGI